MVTPVKTSVMLRCISSLVYYHLQSIPRLRDAFAVKGPQNIPSDRCSEQHQISSSVPLLKREEAWGGERCYVFAAPQEEQAPATIHTTYTQLDFRVVAIIREAVESATGR